MSERKDEEIGETGKGIKERKNSKYDEGIGISIAYIIFGFVVVFLIVLQLIFVDPLQKLDSRMIKGIQSIIPTSLYTETPFKVVTKLIFWYTSSDVFNGALCFLYCAFNTFVSFRLALTANIAIYLHAICILMIYKEPKPYWVVSGIRTADCRAVFTGPAYNQFLATLMVLYFISVFKRYQVIGKVGAGLALIGIFMFLNLMTLLVSIVNAEHFIYQNILGIVIAMVILFLVNSFDKEVTLFSLRLGFFAKNSRKYKFVLMVVLLFICTMCLSIATIVDTNVLIPPDWIRNYNVSFSHNL
eukprot:TRINITY_DN576_c0_g1_i1.p1 TRINITY_DN576_c0_g1~~TRINITY_DN576_c0_g1_i1.p1  ORF type:complete len:300 (-),score=77.26 TRINITY_DN576_c0_g1_i1:555-1454(-)